MQECASSRRSSCPTRQASASRASQGQIAMLKNVRINGDHLPSRWLPGFSRISRVRWIGLAPISGAPSHLGPWRPRLSLPGRAFVARNTLCRPYLTICARARARTKPCPNLATPRASFRSWQLVLSAGPRPCESRRCGRASGTNNCQGRGPRPPEIFFN